MPLNLRQHVLLLTLVPAALVALLLTAFFTYGSIRTLQAEMHQRALATASLLAPISEYSIITGQNDSLQTIVQTAVQENGVKAAMILNTRGKPMAVSGRVSLGGEHFRPALLDAGRIAEGRDWIAYGAPVYRALGKLDPLFDETPDTHREQEIIGFVIIEIDKGEILTAQQGLLHQALLLVGLALLLIGGFARLVAHRFGAPLSRLAMTVRAIGRGDLARRIETRSTGELGDLEAGVNDMASHLQEMRDTMQQRIEAATAQLAYQASRDPLTGLLNRREFTARVEQTLNEIKAGAPLACVLYIDLDRFKPVNDTCGHQAGDDLLCQLSALFAGRLREEDLLARLGGDEFAVLLRNCPESQGLQVAEDLCSMAAAYRFIWQEQVFSITASVGLSLLTPGVRSVKEALGAADRACYRAKASGRNTVCSETGNSQGERRAAAQNVDERIRKALEENHLQVIASPVAGLQPDGATQAPMVLLQGEIRDPVYGNLLLTPYLDDTDRATLARHVQERMLVAACAALARAHEARRPLRCMLPWSAGFEDETALCGLLQQHLEQAGIDGSGIVLLVPEAAIHNRREAILRFSRQARVWGVQFAVDDFGSSLTAFEQMRALNPAYIKITAGLCRELEGDQAIQALLRAIHAIAQDLGAATIAGDVATLADVRSLQTLGIDYVHGSAAGPREPFEVWLEGVVFRGL